MRQRYLRKVIRVRAEDSPNVALGLEQQRQGIEPTGDEILPGVISWNVYQYRRATWDPVRQCIGLDGQFYEGALSLLYPPTWINRAESIAENLPIKRKGEAIGIDTAEGGDTTCWAVCDKRGLIELVAEKTPDTSVICNRTIALMKEYDVQPKNVRFDRGGGGQQHSDNLRARGYAVDTVAFGESANPLAMRHPRLKRWDDKQQELKERYTYRNRRAQMYYLLRLRLDPAETPIGFGIPARYTELRRQMGPMPLKYDEEGRIYLPPKSKKDPNSKVETIQEMLGCSPDELDALVLAVYVMDPASAPIVLKSVF